MKTHLVRAAPGLSVPREGQPRRHITAAKPERVPNTVYYRRRIRDGDLVVLPAKATRSPKTPKKEG